MHDPHRIGPAARSTPDAGGRPGAPTRTLPPDLLREATRRLGIMSLLAAGLWLVGTVLGHLAENAIVGGRLPWQTFAVTDAIAATSIAQSLALFAYTRRSRRAPQFVLDLGLVYLVLMAFDLGLLFHLNGVSHGSAVHPQISWIGASTSDGSASRKTS